MGFDEGAERHGWDALADLIGGRPTAGGRRLHLDGAIALPPDARHLRLEDDLRTLRFDLVATDLPHHARPELRVLELLDERGDVLLVALGRERVHDRLAQGQALDTL